MKKLAIVVGSVFAALVVMVAWANVAGVQALTKDTKADEVVHSSVRKVGRDVNVKGTIYGDVFCAGQNVRIDATVYGDVMCAGADVTVNGKVEGDIRLAGRTVTVNATVSKNASVAATEFLLSGDGKVGQDLTVMGNRLDVKGSVGRDVVANGTEVALDGAIARNAEVNSSDVKLMNSARIGGGLYYTSAREASVGQNAEVKGETTRTEPKKGNASSFNWVLYVFALVSLTLVGMVLALLFPRFMQKTSDRIMQSAPKAALVGFLGGLAMVVLTIGVAFTVVGIPLALLLMLAGMVGMIFSGPVVSYWLGRVILRAKQNASPVLIMFVGTPVLLTLAWLPWIGWPIKLVTYWLGFGALLLALKPFTGAKSAVVAKASTRSKSSK